MMRLNRIHWLELHADGEPFRNSKRTGPGWALCAWWLKHGVTEKVYENPHHPTCATGMRVTAKGRADLAKAIGEQRDHGTYRPRGGW